VEPIVDVHGIDVADMDSVICLEAHPALCVVQAEDHECSTVLAA
jgi:hypothetical protein